MPKAKPSKPSPEAEAKIIAYAADFPAGTIKQILLAVAKASVRYSVAIAIEEVTKNGPRIELRPMIVQHVEKAMAR